MENATSPEAGTAGTDTSFDKGVDDIASLLSEPDEDLQNEEQAHAEQGSGPDDAPDAVDDQVDAEEGDGPDEIAAGGRFVSRDAKVRLDDGTVISVGDLARNNLYQRDYTRKTEELKAERETLKSQRSQSDEIAQALAAQRDFLLSVAQRVLPQPPDPAMLQSDPIGYMQAKSEYEEKVGQLNQVFYQQQAEKNRMMQETEGERAERTRSEAAKLFERAPELRNRETYARFWSDATNIMQDKYGISVEEIEANPDHRFYLAMKDLVRLHKALSKAPKVSQDVQKRPALMKGGARMDPKQRTSREAQQRTEQLRKTGSFDAGVAALMDLNL